MVYILLMIFNRFQAQGGWLGHQNLKRILMLEDHSLFSSVSCRRLCFKTDDKVITVIWLKVVIMPKLNRERNLVPSAHPTRCPNPEYKL